VIAFHGELMRVVPAPVFCEIAVTSFIRPGMMRRCGMLGLSVEGLILPDSKLQLQLKNEKSRG
jgi:hypothetical protein